MKLKLTFTTLLLFFLYSNLFSQGNPVKMTTGMGLGTNASGSAKKKSSLAALREMPFKSEFENITVPGKGIFNFKIEHTPKGQLKKMTVQQYSEDLKRIANKTYNFSPKVNALFNINSIIVLKDNLYFLMRETDRSEHKEKLKWIKFDYETFEFEKTEHELFQSEGKVASSDPSGMWGVSTDYYQLEFSEDSTKLLAWYERVPEKKNNKINKAIIGLHVFDENLQKIWGGEYEMPYTESIMKESSYFLSNKGNAYLMAKIKDGNKGIFSKDANWKVNYYFEVLKFDKNSKSPKTMEVPLGEGKAIDAYINENKYGKIQMAGTYTKKRELNVEGVYLLELNETEEKFTPYGKNGLFEIPDNIFLEYSSKSEKRKIKRKMA
ncbi:MAG: hypothetical protein R2831_08025 [Chitinophagaceae bacterium]